MWSSKSSAGSPPLFSPRHLVTAQAHIGKILGRAEAAHKAGKTKLFNHLAVRYLQSQDARTLATMKAYRAMPWRRRPVRSQLPSIMSGLNAWKGTTEPAIVNMKKKPNGYYRLLMDFGIENRALQYLLLPL